MAVSGRRGPKGPGIIVMAGVITFGGKMSVITFGEKCNKMAIT